VTLAEVAHHFPDARPNGKGYKARCPVHGDHDPSLSIDPGDQGVVLKCRSKACPVEDILAAVGLTTRDLFYVPRDAPAKPQGRATIVATYAYTDATGTVLYEAVRFAPKDFRQRQPDGKGGWTWSMQGVRRVPYALDRLQGEELVYVVEGEKDAEALWGLGIPATTNIGGAGKWTPECSAALVEAGCKYVAVLPDNDPPGLASGRQVADDCTKAGLVVKLVPLPGLPPKGDVSDYLATHTKAELVAVVKDVPRYDPHRSVAADIPLALTSLADLLDKPEVAIDYVVQDRIPVASVCLFCAPPKTGKSTAVRAMALAVAQGEDWCGWRTGQGAVWVFAFEDQESEVVAHFRRMGAQPDDPVQFFCASSPPDLIPLLTARAIAERPRMIILDHLGLVLGIKDFNDYAQTTTAMQPMIALARQSGAAVVLTYHASAHSQREGLDAVMGSTGITASADNIFVMKRDGAQRVIASTQRIGPALEPTVFDLDPATGTYIRQGTKHDLKDREIGDAILASLRDAPEPLTETGLQAAVTARRTDAVRVLRKLVGMGWVQRTGHGGRHDPFRYVVPDTSIGAPTGTSGNKREPTGTSNGNLREPVGTLWEPAGNLMAGGTNREPAGSSSGTSTSTSTVLVPTSQDGVEDDAAPPGGGFTTLSNGATVPVDAVLFLGDLDERGITLRAPAEPGDACTCTDVRLTTEDRAKLYRWRRHLPVILAVAEGRAQ